MKKEKSREPKSIKKRDNIGRRVTRRNSYFRGFYTEEEKANEMLAYKKRNPWNFNGWS